MGFVELSSDLVFTQLKRIHKHLQRSMEMPC